MPGAKFDIQFAGELVEDANPEEVRQRLQKCFKLSDKALARLFRGGPVTVKRGVDTATASSYRKLFRDAGALVRVIPVEAAPESDSSMTPRTEPLPEAIEKPEPDIARKPEPEPEPEPSSAGPGRLALQTPAEQGNEPLEQPPVEGFPVIDTSHLSLAPEGTGTLEDCQPEPEPAPTPDISHLRLAPASTSDDGEPRND